MSERSMNPPDEVEQAIIRGRHFPFTKANVYDENIIRAHIAKLTADLAEAKEASVEYYIDLCKAVEEQVVLEADLEFEKKVSDAMVAQYKYGLSVFVDDEYGCPSLVTLTTATDIRTHFERIVRKGE